MEEVWNVFIVNISSPNCLGTNNVLLDTFNVLPLQWNIVFPSTYSLNHLFIYPKNFCNQIIALESTKLLYRIFSTDYGNLKASRLSFIILSTVV